MQDNRTVQHWHRIHMGNKNPLPWNASSPASVPTLGWPCLISAGRTAAVDRMQAWLLLEAQIATSTTRYLLRAGFHPMARHRRYSMLRLAGL